MLQYIVQSSPFQKGQFFVRTLPGPTYTLKEAISSIIQETALTESEIQGTISALVRHRNLALIAGRKVDLGELGRYSLRVRATLDSPNDPLPKDYELVLAVDFPPQVVPNLKSQVTVERQEVAAHQPTIQAFYDAASKQIDTVYTAGITARINGAFLKFDDQDPEQGAFFIAEDGTAARASYYLTTGAKEVTFNIPAGLSGPQSVEIRARRREAGALLVSDPFGPLAAA